MLQEYLRADVQQVSKLPYIVTGCNAAYNYHLLLANKASLGLDHNRKSYSESGNSNVHFGLGAFNKTYALWMLFNF